MMGADMELVRQFNSEMASIYENKPPISKAKMASITRFAVKALKHYKHIAYAVEKFIQKCHPDYKLPGLYVLDSIIRQSRHQFGLEKDLFGPRFQKNIILLFQNIYQCPQEEKPKVVRVLNLWQRNGIYSPEVISPLVDMASTSSKVLAAQIHKHKKKKTAAMNKDPDDNSLLLLDQANSFLDDSLPLSMEPVESKRDKKRVQVSQDDEIQVLKAQLEQQRKQQELLQQQLQMQIMATKQQALQLQLQQQQMQNKIQEQMQQNSLEVFKTAAVEPPPPTPTATIAAAALATQNSNQFQLLNQIQELTQQLEKDKAALAQLTNVEPVPAQVTTPVNPPPINTAENHSQFLENFQQLIQSAKGIMLKDPRQQNNNSAEDKPQEESSPKFNQALLDTFEYDEDTIGDEQRIQEQKNRLEEEQNRLKRQEREHRDPRSANNDDQPPPKKQLLTTNFPEVNHQPEHSMQGNTSQDDDDSMQIDNDDSEEYNDDDLYQPEQSSVEENHHRNPPPPMAPLWPPEVIRREDRNVAEEEQEQRMARDAREAERKAREGEENWRKEKSVMPPPMMNRLTVASTTLWIGRLPRGTHPSTLHGLFSECGEVKNIDMIEMRGCAFVTMSTRYNADRALRYLRNKRIDGCDVKVAWGQPKNLQEFNKFWEESFGCAFIPWGAFKPFHLRFFVDGAIVDKETLPSGVDEPNNLLIKGPPEEPPQLENNPIMQPRMPPFQRGMPNPGMPNPGMPTHGLPPGMPHPDMLPPPPPMMPPGFRGQFPQLPLPGMPGMMPLGMRPPMPPVGMLPWPPQGLPPGMPAGPRTPTQVGPKPLMPPTDQIRTQHPTPKELMSLLPPPPPLPGAPPNMRGPLFPRPDMPPISMPGRPGFPIPRSEAPFNRPPTSERPRFQPPQPDIRPPIADLPRCSVEQPRLPPGPPILPLWSSNNADKKEESLQEKIPFSSGNIDIMEQLKQDKMDDKLDRRDDQSSDHSRNQTPEKSKEERDRKNRDKLRDSERKDKKDNRRDDPTDRRDRDRDDRRERDDRDERRERDDRDKRRERDDRDERRDREYPNRKGRDDRNDRGERDYRNRDDRDNRRGERGGGREKYGKDEFGRDESNRDDDRKRRDEFGRDDERGRRDEVAKDDDKTRRRDRTPEIIKPKESDSGKEKVRESLKSDEVTSSSDKKELTLDIKVQGPPPGFKSTMQPISEEIDGKLSPRLPTVKSGFKSTMQPVSDGFKSTMQPVADGFKSTMQPVADGFKSTMQPVAVDFKATTQPIINVKTSTDEFKTIAPTGSKSASGKKATGFIPFSIFPFPMQEDDDDNDKEDESKSDDKEDATTPTRDTERDGDDSTESNAEDQSDDNKSSQKDELYDPLELASPSTPETTRASRSTEELNKMEDETPGSPLTESTTNENLQSEDDRIDFDSSAVDIAADNNASPVDNVSPDRSSPLNDSPQLSMFENKSPTADQSGDIVTSSGDHSFNEKSSPVEPSSGLVSSSVDPPFKGDSKGNARSESSADIVTSSVGQVDTSDDGGDPITMPTSTTAVDMSDADQSVTGTHSPDSDMPCSTEAPCESSGNLENNSISTESTMDDKNVNSDSVKSYESNSQVSTSNTVDEVDPCSNSKRDINSDSNADSREDNTEECGHESEVNSEENRYKT